MKMQPITKKHLSLMLALALCLSVFFANGMEAKAVWNESWNEEGISLSVNPYLSKKPEKGETVTFDVTVSPLLPDGSPYEGYFQTDLYVSLVEEGADIALVSASLTKRTYSYTLNTEPEKAPNIHIAALALFDGLPTNVLFKQTELIVSDTSKIPTVSGNNPLVSQMKPGDPEYHAPGVPSEPSEPSEPDEPSGSTQPPVSGNANGGNTEAPVPSETLAYNVVTTDGKTITSSVGGVYAAKSVNGTAVLTTKADIAAAAGLTADAVRSGDNVSFYVCDNYNKKTTAALADAAAALNKKTAAYINCDLYTITQKGVVTKINTTSENVKVSFGLPESVIKAGTAASILCITPDGKTVVLEDTDTDARTITIDTNVFGVYAIIY